MGPLAGRGGEAWSGRLLTPGTWGQQGTHTHFPGGEVEGQEQEDLTKAHISVPSGDWCHQGRMADSTTGLHFTSLEGC